MIAMLLGNSGTLSGSAILASDRPQELQNCATNTALATEPKRRSVVLQPV